MTEHPHHHGHSHAPEHGHGEGHTHASAAELAEVLDLDARILGSYLEEATAWAEELSPKAPATIVDVGAGSGVGTLALALRFPTSAVTALDKSSDMLAMTLKSAAAHGLDGRVTGALADLDNPANLEEAWPASATAELMWASSSLHEMADPERTMAQMFQVLNPGGLLIVVEMDSLPSFLPETLPAGSFLEAGLESRLHAALARKGWNQHPEWTAGLEGAGFTVTRRHFPTAACTTQELAARYARAFLSRIPAALADTAAPADLASLEALLGSGPESLECRGDLVVRGHRTGWAARKP